MCGLPQDVTSPPPEKSGGLLLKFVFDCIKEKSPVTFTTTFNVLRNPHAPSPGYFKGQLAGARDAALWQT